MGKQDQSVIKVVIWSVFNNKVRKNMVDAYLIKEKNNSLKSLAVEQFQGRVKLQNQKIIRFFLKVKIAIGEYN